MCNLLLATSVVSEDGIPFALFVEQHNFKPRRYSMRNEVVMTRRAVMVGLVGLAGSLVVGPLLPSVIILRNQDIVRHGFYSPMLTGILVQGEGEGVAVYGKGVEGFYVDPGKTLVIRFNNQRTGKFSFRCDLHPKMKGEMYVMEIPAA